MKRAHISRRALMAAIVCGTLCNSAAAQTDCVFYADDFSVWSTIERMTIGELLGMLLLLGVLVVLLVIGSARYRAISSAAKQSRSYVTRVLTALFYDRVQEAISVAALFPKSPLAVVVGESVKAGSGLKELGYSKCRFNRALVSQATSLKQDLWILSAIAWSSPAIGLITSLMQPAHYASGPPIALSFGLIIAVPAIWLYRGLSSKVEALLFETDRMSISIVKQLAERCKKQFDNQSSVGHHFAP